MAKKKQIRIEALTKNEAEWVASGRKPPKRAGLLPHPWTQVLANDPHCVCGRDRDHKIHQVNERRVELERQHEVRQLLDNSVPKPEPKEFQRVPVPPAALCNNVRDYFISMLGYPYEANRIEELREEYTLDSVVGEACRKIIEAAAVLNREIAFTCGKGDPKIVEIRAITLYVCEVLAFG